MRVSSPSGSQHELNYPLGFSHDWEYTLDRGNLSTEVFAEMTVAGVANTDSLAQIQKYLPNAYKAYLKILRRMT